MHQVHCANYEVVTTEEASLITFDEHDVPVVLPRKAVGLSSSDEALIVDFKDGEAHVRVVFEALPIDLLPTLRERSSLWVCALNENGVSFANEVPMDWPKRSPSARL